jgi:hypothetical protein
VGTDGAYRPEGRGVVRLCIEPFCRVEGPQKQALCVLGPQPYIAEVDSKYQLSCDGWQSRWCRLLSGPLDQLRRTSDPQIHDLIASRVRLRIIATSFTQATFLRGRNKRSRSAKATPPSWVPFFNHSARSTLCQRDLEGQSVTRHWTYIKAVRMFFSSFKGSRVVQFSHWFEILLAQSRPPGFLVHSSLTHD